MFSALYGSLTRASSSVIDFVTAEKEKGRGKEKKEEKERKRKGGETGGKERRGEEGRRKERREEKGRKNIQSFYFVLIAGAIPGEGRPITRKNAARTPLNLLQQKCLTRVGNRKI